MSEKQLPQHNNAPQELDLFEMFDYMLLKIKQFVRWVFGIAVTVIQIAVSLIAFIIRNIAWVLIFVLLGCALVWWRCLGDYYEAEMQVNANALSEAEAIAYINQLPKLLANKSEQNVIAVAEHLGMSVSDVQKLIKIKAGYGVDLDGDGNADRVSYSQRDTGRVKGVFYVFVSATDDRVVVDMQRGIQAYLYSNPHFRQMAQSRVESLQAQKADLEEQIVRLGALQQLVYSSSTVTTLAANAMGANAMGGNAMGANAMGTNAIILLPLYHNEILGLRESSSRIDYTLATSAELITIVQPFSPLKVDSALELMKRWGSIFALLGLFAAFLWKYRAVVADTLKGGSRLRDMLANLKSA